MAERWAEVASGPSRPAQAELTVGALLALAYPERIAKNRGGGPGSFLLANGRGATIDPASPLAREPFLAREPGSGTRAVAVQMLAGVGVALHPTLEVSSAEGLKRAVLGGGFTLLSERVVAAEIAAGTLAAIPVAGVELRRSLRAIRRTRPAPTGVARSFWEWLGRAAARADPDIVLAPATSQRRRDRR